MMFTVRCPRCHNTMKYQTTATTLSDNAKTCVYCNRSFKVKDHITHLPKGTPKAEFPTA